MDKATGQEAWDAYSKALWYELCKCVVELGHKTQEGEETGFSGAGYSLYMSLENAVDAYCRARQASEPTVPQLTDNPIGVCLSRFAEDPSFLDSDPLVEIDMDSSTIDIVDCRRVHYTKENPYFIKFDTLQSVCDLFDWIRHLEKKTWFTKEHAVQLASRYEFLARNGVLPDAFYNAKASKSPKD